MSLHDLLFRFTRNLPMRLIEVGGAPYLERYHVASFFGRSIWLHHFVRDDQERHVHDHPWPAVSVILTGGYREEVGEVAGDRMVMREREFSAPAINRIPATHRHRIAAVQPHTWTLMLVGKRTGRGWWFYNPAPNGTVYREQPFGDTRRDWYLYAGNRATTYVDRKVTRFEKLIDRTLGRVDRLEDDTRATRIR